MYAIVLTFDRQIQFAQLVIESYRALWPDYPFTFRVPYNEVYPRALIDRPEIELVHTEKDIRATMTNLLSGIEDEAFVFWAIDDRYPYWIRDTNTLEQVVAFVLHATSDIAGVKLTNHAIQAVGDQVWMIGDERFRLQVDFPGGFYTHHFVRSGVLKKSFLEFDLPDSYSIAQFHEKLYSMSSWDDRILVPERPLVHFGESCTRGKMTRNCLYALREYDLEVPDIDYVDRSIIYDDGGRRVSGPKRSFNWVQKGCGHSVLRRIRRSKYRIFGRSKR